MHGIKWCFVVVFGGPYDGGVGPWMNKELSKLEIRSYLELIIRNYIELVFDEYKVLRPQVLDITF